MRTARLATLLLFAGTMLLVGCAKRPANDEAAADSTKAPAIVHDHHHGSGPHGGTLADWGDYHAEFTVDHDRQEATVFVLGGDAATPAPIAAKTLLLSISDPRFQLELAAEPAGEDPKGQASRFVGKDENLGPVREFAGTISGVVGDVPYAGDFVEGAHTH